MVAVKAILFLWRSFSATFSSSVYNKCKSAPQIGKNDSKCASASIKYSRLKQPIFKSTSSQLLQKTEKMSTFDGNQNQINWFDNSDSEFDGREEDCSAEWSPADEEGYSDFDDKEEFMTCDVCDRSFPSAKRLSDHQQKKRHFGCLQCDSIFPSREALYHHREQMDHFDFVSDSEDTSFEDDDDERSDDEQDEETERLL